MTNQELDSKLLQVANAITPLFCELSNVMFLSYYTLSIEKMINKEAHT